MNGKTRSGNGGKQEFKNLTNATKGLIDMLSGVGASITNESVQSNKTSSVSKNQNGKTVKNKVETTVSTKVSTQGTFDFNTTNAEKNLDKLVKKATDVNAVFERLRTTLGKLSSVKSGGLDISGLLKNINGITGTDSKIQNLISGAVGTNKNDFNNGAVFGRLKGSLSKIINNVKTDTEKQVNDLLQYIDSIDKFLEQLDKDVKQNSSAKVEPVKVPTSIKRGKRNVTIDDIVKTFGLQSINISKLVSNVEKEQEYLNELYDYLETISSKTGITPSKLGGNKLKLTLSKLKAGVGKATGNSVKIDVNEGFNENAIAHEIAHSYLHGLIERLYGGKNHVKNAGGYANAVKSIFNDSDFSKLISREGVSQNDINIANIVREIVAKALKGGRGNGNLLKTITQNSNGKQSDIDYYSAGSEVFARIFGTAISGKQLSNKFELNQKTFDKLIAPYMSKLFEALFSSEAQNNVRITGSKSQHNQIVKTTTDTVKRTKTEKEKNAGVTKDTSLADSRRSLGENFKSVISDANSLEQNIKNVLLSSAKLFEENFRNVIGHISETFRNEIVNPIKEVSKSMSSIIVELRKSGIVTTGNDSNNIGNVVKKVVNTEYAKKDKDDVAVPEYQAKKEFSKPMLSPGDGKNGIYSRVEGTTPMTKPNADALAANNRQIQAQNNWAKQLSTARRLQQQSIDMNMFGWVEEGTTQDSYTRELTNRYNQLKRIETMFKKLNDKTNMKKVSQMLSVFENFKGASGDSLFKNGKIDLTPNIIYQTDAEGKKQIVGVKGIDTGDLKPLLTQIDNVIKTSLKEIDTDTRIKEKELDTKTRIKEKDKIVNDMFQRYLKVENVFDDLTKNLNQNKFNTTGEALLNKYIIDNLQSTDPNLQAKAKEYQQLLNKVNNQYGIIQNDIMSGVYDNQAGNFKTTFDYFKSDINKLNDIIKELFAQERARVNERQDNRVNAFNAASSAMDWKLYQIDSFIRKSGIDPNTVIDAQSGLSLADFRADIAQEISDFKLLDPLKHGRDELYQIIRDTQQAINKMFLDMKDGASNISNQMKNQAKIDKELHTEDLRTQKQYQSLDGAMNKLNEWYNDSFKVGDSNFTRKEFYSDILKNTSEYTAVTQLYQDLNQRIASGEFKSDPQAFAIAIKQFIESINSFKTNVNNAVKQMETDYQTSKSQEAEGNKRLAELNKINKKETRVENLIASMQKSLVSYDLWMDENKFIGDQNIQNGDIGFVNAQGQVTNARQMRAVLENMILNASMVQANAGTMTDEQLNTFVRDAKNAFDNVIKIVQSSADDTLKLQQHAEAERTRLIREATSIQTSGLRTASNFESQLNRIVRNPTMNTLFANSGDPYLRGNIKVNLTEAEGLEIGNRMNRIQDLENELLREVAGESETQRIARWTRANEQLAYEQLAQQNMIERIGVRVRPAGEAFNEYQEVYAPLMQRFGQTTGFNIFNNPNERSVNWETIGRGFVSGNRGNYSLEIAKFINFPSLKQGLQSLYKDLQGILSGVGRMLSSAFDHLYRLGKTTLTSLTVAIGGLTAGVTGAIAAFTAFGKSVVSTTDEFRRNTLSLTGVYRTPARAHEMLQMAYRTSSNMPMDYSSAMTTLNEISAIPAVQRVLRSPDRAVSQSMMDKMFKVITAMTTMRPDKTASDAVFSLRNAFAGDLRSLQRRFDLPTSAMPNVRGGIGLGGVKNDPMEMLDSLNEYFDSFLDMNVINQVSRTIGVITDKIKGAFDLFKANIGTSGFYDLVLKDVDRIKNVFVDFVDSDYGREIARRLSDALGNAYEAVKNIATKIGQSILGAFGFTGNINIGDIVAKTGEAFAKTLRYVEKVIDGLDIEGYIKRAIDYISNIDIENVINNIVDGGKRIADTIREIIGTIASLAGSLNEMRKRLGITDGQLGAGIFFTWLFGAGNIASTIGSAMHMIQSTIMTALGAIGSYISMQTAYFTLQGTQAATAIGTAFTNLFTVIKTGLKNLLVYVVPVVAEIYLIGTNFEVLGETFANALSFISGAFENIGNELELLGLKYDKFVVNSSLPDKMKQTTLNKYKKETFNLNSASEFNDLINSSWMGSKIIKPSVYSEIIRKYKDTIGFNKETGHYYYDTSKVNGFKEKAYLLRFVNYLTRKSDIMTKEEINDTLDKRIADVSEKISSSYENKYKENEKIYNPEGKKWSLVPSGTFFGLHYDGQTGTITDVSNTQTGNMSVGTYVKKIYDYFNNKLSPFIKEIKYKYDHYFPEGVDTDYVKLVNGQTEALNKAVNTQKQQYVKGFGFETALSVFGTEDDNADTIYFGPKRIEKLKSELRDSIGNTEEYINTFNTLVSQGVHVERAREMAEKISENGEAVTRYINEINNVINKSIEMIEDSVASAEFKYLSKDVGKYISAQTRVFGKKLNEEVYMSIIQEYSSYFATNIDNRVGETIKKELENRNGDIYRLIGDYRNNRFNYGEASSSEIKIIDDYMKRLGDVAIQMRPIVDELNRRSVIQGNIGNMRLGDLNANWETLMRDSSRSVRNAAGERYKTLIDEGIETEPIEKMATKVVEITANGFNDMKTILATGVKDLMTGTHSIMKNGLVKFATEGGTVKPMFKEMWDNAKKTVAGVYSEDVSNRFTERLFQLMTGSTMEKPLTPEEQFMSTISTDLSGITRESSVIKVDVNEFKMNTSEKLETLVNSVKHIEAAIPALQPVIEKQKEEFFTNNKKIDSSKVVASIRGTKKDISTITPLEFAESARATAEAKYAETGKTGYCAAGWADNLANFTGGDRYYARAQFGLKGPDAHDYYNQLKTNPNWRRVQMDYSKTDNESILKQIQIGDTLVWWDNKYKRNKKGELKPAEHIGTYIGGGQLASDFIESLYSYGSKGSSEWIQDRIKLYGLPSVYRLNTKTDKFISKASSKYDKYGDPLLNKATRKPTDIGDDYNKYDDLIKKAAEKYNLEINLIKGLINTESSFENLGENSKGAMGIMQVKQDATNDVNRKFKTNYDRTKTEDNIMVGAGYLRMMIDRTGGNIPLALTAYNAGYGNLQKAIEKGNNYASTVLMFKDMFDKGYNGRTYSGSVGIKRNEAGVFQPLEWHDYVQEQEFKPIKRELTQYQEKELEKLDMFYELALRPVEMILNSELLQPVFGTTVQELIEEDKKLADEIRENHKKQKLIDEDKDLYLKLLMKHTKIKTDDSLIPQFIPNITVNEKVAYREYSKIKRQKEADELWENAERDFLESESIDKIYRNAEKEFLNAYENEKLWDSAEKAVNDWYHEFNELWDSAEKAVNDAEIERLVDVVKSAVEADEIWKSAENDFLRQEEEIKETKEIIKDIRDYLTELVHPSSITRTGEIETKVINTLSDYGYKGVVDTIKTANGAIRKIRENAKENYEDLFAPKEPVISDEADYKEADVRAMFKPLEPVISKPVRDKGGLHFTFKTTGNYINRAAGGFMANGSNIGHWFNNMLFGTGDYNKETGEWSGDTTGILGGIGSIMEDSGGKAGGLGGILKIAGGLVSGKGIPTAIAKYLGTFSKASGGAAIADLTSPAGIISSGLGAVTKFFAGHKAGAAVASSVKGFLTTGVGSAILPVAALAYGIKKLTKTKDKTAEGRARYADFQSLKQGLVDRSSELDSTYALASDLTRGLLTSYDFGDIWFDIEHKGGWKRHFKGTARDVAHTDATAFINTLTGYHSLMSKAANEQAQGQVELNTLQSTNNMAYLQKSAQLIAKQANANDAEMKKYQDELTKYAGKDANYKQTLFDGKEYTLAELESKVEEFISTFGELSEKAYQLNEDMKKEQLNTEYARLDYELARDHGADPLMQYNNELKKLELEWKSVNNGRGYEEGTREWYEYMTRWENATQNLENATEEMEKSAKELAKSIGSNWVQILSGIRNQDGNYMYTQVRELASWYSTKANAETVLNKGEYAWGEKLTDIDRKNEERNLENATEMIDHLTAQYNFRNSITGYKQNITDRMHSGTSVIAGSTYGYDNVTEHIADYASSLASVNRYSEDFLKTGQFSGYDDFMTQIVSPIMDSINNELNSMMDVYTQLYSSGYYSRASGESKFMAPMMNYLTQLDNLQTAYMKALDSGNQKTIDKALKNLESFLDTNNTYFKKLGQSYQQAKDLLAQASSRQTILSSISGFDDYEIANKALTAVRSALGNIDIGAFNELLGVNTGVTTMTGSNIKTWFGVKGEDPYETYYELQKKNILQQLQNSEHKSDEWNQALIDLWNLMLDNAKYLEDKMERLPDTIDRVLGSMSGYEDYEIANSALTEFNKALGNNALNNLVGGTKGLTTFTDSNIAKWFGVSGEDPYETYYEYQKKTILDRIKKEQEGSEDWYNAELDLWNLMMENAKYLKDKAEKTSQTIEDMLDKINETVKTRVAEEAKTSKGDIIFIDLGSTRGGGANLARQMLNAVKTQDPDAQKLIQEYMKKMGLK